MGAAERAPAAKARGGLLEAGILRRAEVAE